MMVMSNWLSGPRRGAVRWSLLGLLAWMGVASAAETTPAGPELPRLRAVLAGLTYRPAATSVVFGGEAQVRWRPAALPVEVRRRLGELSLALVREGGYETVMAGGIFPVADPETHAAALPLRQLDHQRRLEQEAAPAAPVARPAAPGGITLPRFHVPAPTPLPGDYTRFVAVHTADGAGQARDFQAMAPAGGQAEGNAPATPGTLVYLVPLAASYAGFQRDGLAASSHLASWIDDDYRAAACARVGFALLADLLAGDAGGTGGAGGRDALVRRAAAAAGDPEVERSVLAARVREWRHLRDESTALGRLERCLWLWYRSKDSRSLLVEAGERLDGWETRGYVAALAGSAYGSDHFPSEAVMDLLRNRPLDDLAFRLCELGGGGAVLAVSEPAAAPEPEVLADLGRRWR